MVSPLLAMIAACGINPAFKLGDGSADASADGSEAAAPLTTSTHATTTAATTSTATTSTGETTTAVDPTTSTSSDPSDPTTSTTADTAGKDPACPEDLDLIACYTFTDHGTTVLVDGAGHIPDGSITGVTYGPSLEPGLGTAVEFADVSRIDIPDHPLLNPQQFTLMVFAYLTPDPGSQTIVDKDNQFSLTHAGNQVLCIVVSKEGSYASASAFALVGAWHHLTCTFDGTNIRLDARSMQQSQPGNAALVGSLAPTSPSPMAIGRNIPEDDAPMLGRLDNLLYFSRALAPDEACAYAGILCEN